MKNFQRLIYKIKYFFSKKYYFIASVRVYGNDDLSASTDSRCWGFFLSKKRAIKAVEENWTDMHENGYYPYVVIETYTEGLLSQTCNEYLWFKESYKQLSLDEVKELYNSLDDKYKENARINTSNGRVEWLDENGWHTNFEGYTPCDPPEWSKGTIGWCIG